MSKIDSAEQELITKFDEMLENEIPNFRKVMTSEEYNELFCYYRDAKACRRAAEKARAKDLAQEAQKETNRASHWEDLIRQGLKPIKDRANTQLNVYGGRAHQK